MDSQRVRAAVHFPELPVFDGREPEGRKAHLSYPDRCAFSPVLSFARLRLPFPKHPKGFFEEDHVPAQNFRMGLLYAGYIYNAFVAFEYRGNCSADMMDRACKVERRRSFPAFTTRQLPDRK